MVDEVLDRPEVPVVLDEVPLVEVLALEHHLDHVVVPVQVVARMVGREVRQGVGRREMELLLDSVHQLRV